MKIDELYAEALELEATISVPLIHREANSDYAMAYEDLKDSLRGFERAERGLRLAVKCLEKEKAKAEENETDEDEGLTEEDIQRMGNMARDMIIEMMKGRK